MDAVFRALADPNRRALLSLLRQHGRLNLGALAEHFELSLATVSSHMRILTEAGLVERDKRGRDVYFTINTSVGEDLLAALVGLLAPGGKSAASDKPSAGQAKGIGDVKRAGK
jgi:DNA-binding transcriptional ArsR family regulator